jgi:hypothetical protein
MTAAVTAVLPRPRPASEDLPSLPVRAPAEAPGACRAVASERVLHQLVRRELRLLADLVPWAPAGDLPRARALARHAELLGRVLLHHHAVERDRIWPALRRSLPGDDALPGHLDRWRARCARIDNALRDVGTAARQWSVAGTARTRDAFALACRDLADAVEVQMAEEERTLLPLLEAHLDPAEWTAIVRTGRARFSPRERLLVLGLALEDACAGDRRRLLSGVPRTTRIAWRLYGCGRYRATVVRLRGEPPAA